MNFSIFSDERTGLFREVWRPFPVGPDEMAVKRDAGFCEDLPVTSIFHPGRRCYRQIANRTMCESRDHVCFGPDGEIEHSPDGNGPAVGRNADGTCRMGLRCSVKHWLFDVLPSWTL